MAKARLVIKLLDGTHRPIRSHKINVAKVGDLSGQDVVTGADGTGAADLDDDVVRFQIAPAEIRGENGPIFGSIFVFDVASDGTVTEFSKHSNEVSIGRKRIEGIDKITDIIIVFPRIMKVDDTDPRLPSFWKFPQRSTILPDSSVESSFQIKFPISALAEPSVFLFEILHLKRPALVAVAVPKNPNKVNRFLLFYHHTLSLQNRAIFQGASYPFGLVYLDRSVYNYLDGTDTGSGLNLMLAYQFVAAAGSTEALVLPCPEFGVGEEHELGQFNSNPSVVQAVLEEIGGFFSRQKQDFSIPDIDRFRIAHFSSGIMHTGTFLQARGGLVDKVQEIYDLDGSTSDWSKIYPPTSFRKRGRIVRIYNQDASVTDDAGVRSRAGHEVFSLPWGRWDVCPDPLRPSLTNPADRRRFVHDFFIARHMLFRSLKLSPP
jgi:hypothetical protein